MRKSNHFVRVLDRPAVNGLIKLLEVAADKEFPIVKSRQESFEIKAPDGEIVLSGLIHSNRKHYLCRLHREVFSDA